ncbi:MAG: hypothetical protein HQ557_20145 [Bacteroidetes bacterium]|nr:hypothetical protein [Bacteroidota bacterium]
MADKKEIMIKYIFPDDHNPKYTNGAVGGVSPRGDIVVNFYFERQPIPNKDFHNVTPEGTLGDLIDRDPKNFNDIIIRYIQNGVVFDLENALTFHKWLGDRINELSQAKKR